MPSFFICAFFYKSGIGNSKFGRISKRVQEKVGT